MKRGNCFARPCFSHYAGQPKCERCGMEIACLTATLGGLAECGLLREEFVPVLGEHIYSLTEKGRKHLARKGLIAPAGRVSMGPRRGKNTLRRRPTMVVNIDLQRQEISFVSRNCIFCSELWTHILHIKYPENKDDPFSGEIKKFHVCPKHLAIAQSNESLTIVKIEMRRGNLETKRKD